jgi:4-amino-4-deoxy-L-arabinose transferase-like glycosyltransferase
MLDFTLRSEKDVSPNQPDRRRLPVPAHVFLLLACATILLIMWAFTVPIFEAPDEPHHWDYARYVHDHWKLPFYTTALLEANQPPLYYFLIAPVAKRAEVPPTKMSMVNGVLLSPSAPRFFEESPGDLKRYWPLRWARLITALFSIVTVLFTYLGGYETTGNRYTGLLAAGLVVFLPQFTFRGTNISNDAMVATTSALATYFVIRIVTRGFSWRIGCAASVCVALAFLSKISAIIFLLVLVFVLLLGNVSWQIKLKRFAVLIPAGMIVLPWLIRNQALYGDPLATKRMPEIVPVLIAKKPVWSSYFITTFPELIAKSFVGVFGWMNIYLPDFIYWIFGTLAIIGIAGFIRSLIAGCVNRHLAIMLAALPVLALGSVAHLNLTFNQPQGRYLFPALPALMILVAIGLEGLPRWNPRLMYATLILCAAINLYALFGIEFPTYWRVPSGSERAAEHATISPLCRSIHAVVGTAVENGY